MTKEKEKDQFWVIYKKKTCLNLCSLCIFEHSVELYLIEEATTKRVCYFTFFFIILFPFLFFLLMAFSYGQDLDTMDGSLKTSRTSGWKKQWKHFRKHKWLLDNERGFPPCKIINKRHFLILNINVTGSIHRLHVLIHILKYTSLVRTTYVRQKNSKNLSKCFKNWTDIWNTNHYK